MSRERSVQSTATDFIQSLEEIGVKCVVRPFSDSSDGSDGSDGSAEKFCTRVEDEVDFEYAIFDGTRRPAHFAALQPSKPADVACCDACVEEQNRSNKLLRLSKAAAAASTDQERRMVVAIVPCMEAVPPPWATIAFTAILPNRMRTAITIGQGVESFRDMVRKDYLSTAAEDSACSLCRRDKGKVTCVRCANCMSHLCVYCLSMQTLRSGRWRVAFECCGHREDFFASINQLNWHERNSWPSIWIALEAILKRLGRPHVDVSIIRECGDLVHSTIALINRGVDCKRPSARRKVLPPNRRNVHFVGAAPVTQSTITAGDAVFVIGDLPDPAADDATVMDAMRKGILLSANPEDNAVIEVKDLFCIHSVLAARNKGTAISMDPSPSDCDDSETADPSRQSADDVRRAETLGDMCSTSGR